ncbi:hypothetical protein GK62_16035 [Salmonella enterica subsp. enterica serovar Dublin]|nr:hypothetical protein [Salmonella enterica subsp. enterica serovar Dublin]
MNGALVIPKLMCIKFHAEKIDSLRELSIKKPAARLVIRSLITPYCRMALSQRFKRFDTLQMRRNIFEFVSLFLIPHNFIKRVKRLR